MWALPAPLLEPLAPPQPFLLGLVALRIEGEPRVLRCQLLQTPLLAPLGRPHLDPRAAALAQELFQRRKVSRIARHDDLRWNRRRRAVVLDAESLEQRRGLLPLDVLAVEAVPVDHPAPPEREDLHRRLVAVAGEPEYVDIADAPLLDRLAIAQPADREQAGSGT